MIVHQAVGQRVKALIDEGKFHMMEWEFLGLPLVVEVLEKMYNEFFLEDRDNLIGINKYWGFGRVIADEPEFHETMYGRRILTMTDDLLTIDKLQTFIDRICGDSLLAFNTVMLCGSINAVLESFAPDGSREPHLFNLRLKAVKDQLDRFAEVEDPVLQEQLKRIRSMPLMRTSDVSYN